MDIDGFLLARSYQDGDNYVFQLKLNCRNYMDYYDETDSATTLSFSQTPVHVSSMRTSSSLQKILTSIELERQLEISSTGSETSNRTFFWTDLFERCFLSEDNNHDDLLFYVFRDKTRQTKWKSELKVFRSNWTNLPKFDEPLIDWEETVYLNLIMHYFTYEVTVAICTRTGPQELEIVRKFSKKLFASPSHRRMDVKSRQEEIVYPQIHFTIDDFEEIFEDCVLHDSESLCVELTAFDRCGRLQGTIFLGNVRYTVLKDSLDTHYASTLHHRSPSTLFARIRPGAAHQRQTIITNSGKPQAVQFMRMRGPHGKGHAELAVAATKESRITPVKNDLRVDVDFSPGSSSIIQGRPFSSENVELAAAGPGSTRLSRQGSKIGDFFANLTGTPASSGAAKPRANGLRKAMSDGNDLSSLTDASIRDSGGMGEVESTNVDEEFNDASQFAGGLAQSGLSGRSFGQSWYWFKERRRLTSVGLHIYLTYISLPWHRIIADMLEARQEPILSFAG